MGLILERAYACLFALGFVLAFTCVCFVVVHAFSEGVHTMAEDLRLQKLKEQKFVGNVFVGPP